MSIPGESRGFWASVRRLPERTPLRVKLITAVLALVAIALVVISVAGLAFLRDYLLNQADNEVAAISNEQDRLQGAVSNYMAGGQPVALNGLAVVWIPNGGKPHPIVQEPSGYPVPSPKNQVPGGSSASSITST